MSAAYFGAPAARAEPSLWFLEKVEITRGAIADHLSKTLSFLFIKSFNELAARADLNFDDCVDFLAEENHDSFERQIAILSVHKASLSAHLEFIERMAGLVAEGKVTSSEFEYALSPLKVFSTVVSDSYDDPRERSILTRALDTPNLADEAKITIKKILAGPRWPLLAKFLIYCCDKRPAFVD